MSEIAHAAGVGRATLHRHFRQKNDLLITIGAQCVAEMNAAVLAVDSPDSPAVDRLFAMLTNVIPLGDRYAFLRFEWLEDESLQMGYEAQLEWATALVEHLKSEREIAEDVPTSWAVAQVDQVIWNAWNAVSTGQVSADDATQLAMRTLLKGLG